ncbi:unnamed protein product, partial [Polarella glacialis]
TTYRHELPDGSFQEKTTFRCPVDGCDLEADDMPMLARHALEAHGLQMGGFGSGAAGHEVPEPLGAPDCEGAGPKQRVTRLRLPNGEICLVCPVCGSELPDDEAAFLEHVASSHGRALAAPGGKVGGESDHLDMLHQSSSEHWYPRRDEALRQLHVISLGSFCGMKFSIQRLGLGDAHLPFDWIRSTSEGVAKFVRNGFQGFFSVATACDVPSFGMRVHRAQHHSFWHDDVSQLEVREKMKRRVARFLALADE